MSVEELKQLCSVYEPMESDVGYFPFVDLKIPANIHDKLSDLPPVARHLIVTKEMLHLEEDPPATKTKKLVPNLLDQENYGCIIQNLQLMLELGIELVKVRKVIKYKQSPFMRKYTSFNIQQRISAKASGDKLSDTLYKLNDNGNFGKAIENPRNYETTTIVFSPKMFKKKVGSMLYKSYDENEYSMIVRSRKQKIVFNKPIYVGVYILEASKHLMFTFWYKHLKPKFIDNTMRLMYMDTDSFIIYFKGNETNKKLKELSNSTFDFSNLPEDDELHSKVNATRVGVLQDQTPGRKINTFRGVSPKCYLYELEEKEEKTEEKMTYAKCKGIPELVSDKLSREDFEKGVLQDKEREKRDFYTIRTHQRQLVTQHVTKRVFSFTTKRILTDDKKDSLAIGHSGAKKMKLS